jgi:hypothetical protein
MVGRCRDHFREVEALSDNHCRRPRTGGNRRAVNIYYKLAVVDTRRGDSDIAKLRLRILLDHGWSDGADAALVNIGCHGNSKRSREWYQRLTTLLPKGSMKRKYAEGKAQSKSHHAWLAAESGDVQGIRARSCHT